MNPTAVVGRRVGAFIIDLVLSWALTVGIFFATSKSSNTSCGLTPESDAWQGVGTELFGGDCRFFASGGAFAAYLIISLLVSIGLFWAWPALTGCTPGKAAVGIRIIRRDGHAPGFGRVFVRQIMWIVDAFPYIIPYLTGFLVALNDKHEHRRLGDRAAGTLVVDKAAAGHPFHDDHHHHDHHHHDHHHHDDHHHVAGGSPQSFNAGPSAQPAPVGGGGGPAPGWYDDPQREARLRYWDGSAWTSHTSA